jgi:hypothetical protein
MYRSLDRAQQARKTPKGGPVIQQLNIEEEPK